MQRFGCLSIRPIAIWPIASSLVAPKWQYSQFKAIGELLFGKGRWSARKDGSASVRLKWMAKTGHIVQGLINLNRRSTGGLADRRVVLISRRLQQFLLSRGLSGMTPEPEVSCPVRLVWKIIFQTFSDGRLILDSSDQRSCSLL